MSDTFLINVNTRAITVPPDFVDGGVKSDHNAKKIKFEIDRFYNNEDLSTHSVAVQYVNANGEKDVYTVTDMDLTVDDKISFTWSISNHVTKYSGKVSFVIRFYSIENNKFTYTYNTQIASFSVLDGITVVLSDISSSIDILTEWNSVIQTINNLPTTVVHKTGNETIGGIKTFVDKVFAPNIVNGETVYGGSIVDDLNVLIKSGFYTAFSTANGVPNTSYSWTVQHINDNYNSNTAYQRAIANSSVLLIKERTKSSGVWSAWTNQLQMHIEDLDNPHNVTKEQVGLGNIINEVQILASQRGSINGVAELDENGKVPSSQLPSYVDDVLEYSALSSFPTIGEGGKIYVDTSSNLTYRWTGTVYVEISKSIALGEASSTAYRGDRGKEAYDHAMLTSGNPHNVTKSDIGLGNVNNTSDMDKPINTATQEILNQLTGDLTDTNVSYSTTLSTFSPKVHKLARTLWIEGSFVKPGSNYALNDTILTLSSPLTSFSTLGSSPCILRNSTSGITAIGAITFIDNSTLKLTICPDGYNELRLVNSFPFY